MIYTKKCASNWCINVVRLTVWQVCLKYLRFRLCLHLSLSVISRIAIWSISVIQFLYTIFILLYHWIIIWQIWVKWPNGNLGIHMKLVNIYLFPKLTQLQSSGPQICLIAIRLITLKLKRKLTLSYWECAFALVGFNSRYWLHCHSNSRVSRIKIENLKQQIGGDIIPLIFGKFVTP